jgi:hypothetical protein
LHQNENVVDAHGQHQKRDDLQGLWLSKKIVETEIFQTSMTSRVEGMPANPNMPSEHATEISTTKIPPVASVTLESICWSYNEIFNLWSLDWNMQ